MWMSKRGVCFLIGGTLCVNKMVRIFLDETMTGVTVKQNGICIVLSWTVEQCVFFVW